MYRLEGDATQCTCKNPPLSDYVAPYFRWRATITGARCTTAQSSPSTISHCTLSRGCYSVNLHRLGWVPSRPCTDRSRDRTNPTPPNYESDPHDRPGTLVWKIDH